MKRKAKTVAKQPKQLPVTEIKYLAMPSMTIEGRIFTTNPQGDHKQIFDDMKTLVESKLGTALFSMKDYLGRNGIVLDRFEISTSISYNQPPKQVNKSGKGN